MTEIAEKLEDYRKRKRWNVKTAAAELGVSTASFYLYRKKKDLPRFEVLQKAHDLWGITFEHLNVAPGKRRSSWRRTGTNSQLVLPFLETVREEDVEVVQVSARKPSSMEVTLKIRFTG
jgi:transcriptional regulator with XRE-family HTH domain